MALGQVPTTGTPFRRQVCEFFHDIRWKLKCNFWRLTAMLFGRVHSDVVLIACVGDLGNEMDVMVIVAEMSDFDTKLK